MQIINSALVPFSHRAVDEVSEVDEVDEADDSSVLSGLILSGSTSLLFVPFRPGVAKEVMLRKA